MKILSHSAETERVDGAIENCLRGHIYGPINVTKMRLFILYWKGLPGDRPCLFQNCAVDHGATSGTYKTTPKSRLMSYLHAKREMAIKHNGLLCRFPNNSRIDPATKYFGIGQSIFRSNGRTGQFLPVLLMAVFYRFNPFWEDAIETIRFLNMRFFFRAENQ